MSSNAADVNGNARLEKSFAELKQYFRTAGSSLEKSADRVLFRLEDYVNRIVCKVYRDGVIRASCTIYLTSSRKSSEICYSIRDSLKNLSILTLAIADNDGSYRKVNFYDRSTNEKMELSFREAKAKLWHEFLQQLKE